jgi:hypothetical protein
LSPSTALGVGHVETIFTTPGKETVIFDPSSRLPVALAVPIVWPPSPSALVGVGHVDKATSLATDDDARLPDATFFNTSRLPVSFQSLACGVDQGDSSGTKS